MRGRLILVLLTLLAPPFLAAQEADTALAERVRRLEDLVRILRQQLDEQAGAGVGSREGYRVELGGHVLVNGFYNDSKVNNSDVPQFVLPPDPPGGLPPEGLGATVRQTRLTLFALAPGVLGGALTGEVDADFFGGQQPSSGGRTFPLLRLRRVRADLVWRHASVMVGQEAPLVAEPNPSSLAALGFPEFAGSGNLWLWIPQVRVGISGGRAARAGVDVAVLAPTAATAQDVFTTQPDRAERSARPFVQGRVFARWGDPSAPSEISAGGHLGWLATAGDSLLTSQAVAGAVRLVLTRYVELAGEAFLGDALGVLGGGGIGQSLGVGDVPVRTKGGWGQVVLRPIPEVEIGAGAGWDDPRDTDLDPATARLENRTFSGHLTWRPRPLAIGVTARRIGTLYGPAVGRIWDTHVNLVFGLAF
jgi:hypothetical protein